MSPATKASSKSTSLTRTNRRNSGFGIALTISKSLSFIASTASFSSCKFTFLDANGQPNLGKFQAKFQD
jgi:hypothetical protein